MAADPLLILAAVATVVLGGALAVGLWRRGVISRHRRLSLERGWMYSPSDRFELAGRVGPLIEVPGAADVVVTDVLYRSEQGVRHYLARVYFTTGTFTTRSRRSIYLRMRESGDSFTAALDADDRPASR